MPFTVYCDESGKGELPVFVMAGFVARAEQWAAFNEEWTTVLNEPPAISAFHMTDARWHGYDTKLPKLIEVIKRHVIVGLAVSVDHADYNQLVKGVLGKRADNPYLFILYSIIILATSWQKSNGINEEMDFIFDEQRDQSDYIQSIWSKILDSMDHDVRERVGGRPIDADDYKVIPLQASDIFAWSVRRGIALRREGKPLDPSLEHFFNELPLAAMHIDKQALTELISKTKEGFRSAGTISEHQYRQAIPNRDQLNMYLNKLRLADAREGDTIPFYSFPAKQTKRFRLVHNCPTCNIPHLHKRVGGECLAGEQDDQ